MVAIQGPIDLHYGVEELRTLPLGSVERKLEDIFGGFEIKLATASVGLGSRGF